MVELANAKRSIERNETLTDVIVAIVIVMIVSQIPSPLPGLNVENLWWVIFIFGLTFLILGRFWYTHHNLFTQLRRINMYMIFWNFVFLFGVAFLPFAIKLIFSRTGALFYGVIIYAVNMVLMSFSF